MKMVYVKDLLRGSGSERSAVDLSGWVKSRRNGKDIVFLDICDSTGMIQAVVKVENAAYVIAKNVPVESSVKVIGILESGSNAPEIRVEQMQVIGSAAEISPHPRSPFDIFDVKMADHLLKNRHLYLRNDKVMAILRFRHLAMMAMRDWFNQKGYIEITAPVLTPAPLYEDGTAMPITVHDENVFLTQCVGFYLESAVHAFEKVYNIGPSFRAEETRSKRHLMEYWHIKAELAWVSVDDLMAIVEDMIGHVVRFSLEHHSDIPRMLGTELCVDGLSVPFPRITYVEAVNRLSSLGVPFEFGASLGSDEEEILSRGFSSPFWITGIPRKIEPFPYVIDVDDSRVTRTADLIATNGYGELLGVAEKISTLPELDDRMKEKGKFGDPRYEWLRQMREFGCVPHGGFGMGVERFIRWLLNIPHVRDTIPFPRIFRRKIAP